MIITKMLSFFSILSGKIYMYCCFCHHTFYNAMATNDLLIDGASLFVIEIKVT